MSMFRTSNASLQDEPSIPDGPTERINDRRSAPNKTPKKTRSLLPVLLALLALNVAAVAVFVAWRAGVIARSAAQTEPSAAVSPVAPAAVRENYAVSYAQEPLRVQVGCSAVLFVDLDEPRANAGEQVSDLRYDSRCGDQPPHLTLGPGAAGGSQVQNSDTDAAGCEKAIRTSPIGPGASVEVRKGAVLCVLTAGKPAEMVLVEITDVGKTGTAGMRATSWQVTG
jgi:hypothetical protein